MRQSLFVQKGNIMKKLNVEKLNALVDARVQADIESGKVGGAALCVVQDGKVLLRKLYGYKNVDTKEPLQFDTMYRLASMTKPITAVAALIAQEQGLLTIDDPLYKYIPAYEHMKIGHMEDGKPVYDKDAVTPITIKHLLSHTSGIGTLEIGDYEWARMPEENAKTPEGVMEWFADKMLAFEPYTAQWYSPVAAFVAVARIIEIVSGMPYNAFLDKYLFGPLGMDQTTFELSEDQKARMIAMHTYTEEQGGFAVPKSVETIFENIPVTQCNGGAGLAATLDDYVKFGEMLTNGGEYNGVRILSPESVAQMSTVQVTDAIMGPPQQWGLGVRVITGEYQMPLGCFGWSGAYGTHYWSDPENKITAVYMKNSGYDGGSGALTAFLYEQDVYASLEE